MVGVELDRRKDLRVELGGLLEQRMTVERAPPAPIDDRQPAQADMPRALGFERDGEDEAAVGELRWRVGLVDLDDEVAPEVSFR